MIEWKKRGKIFDPADNILADGCTDFAKSPQAVEFDGFVRVYFTSQRKTENGKWVSCPQFADYTKDFSRLIRVADKPVMAQGGLGMFDEHGIFPISVTRHNDRILAYTCGWTRRVSVSIDMAIGLAESFDGGETFTRHGIGGPVMTASMNEACLIGDGFVRVIGDVFHMWYIYGTAWKQYEGQTQPCRIYKIAQATSKDGINWERNGKSIIPDTFDDECQALPSVIEYNGRYHMVFCYRKAYDFHTNKNNSYRLGYAYSDDLVTWTRADDALNIDRANEGWDSGMMCYPNFFTCEGKVYLLYNGNEFGRHGFGIAEAVSFR